MPTEAELLADLLDGKVDAAEVPAELAELASLADAVSQHVTLVPPTDAFREALREQVVQSAGGAAGSGTGIGGSGGAGGATTTVTAATGAATSGGVSAIIAGIAATAVLAASTVAAADRAGPGDLLAGVDRGLESAQLAVADSEREAELLVDFAAERVLEAVGLVDTAVVSGLLDRADALLEEALALGVAQGRDLEELVSPFTASLRTLSSRTDDPGVLAQIERMFDELGVEAGVPGTTVDDDASPLDADPSSGDDAVAPSTDDEQDGGEATPEGSSDADQPAGAGDVGDDPTDPLDDLDDPLDDLDDPLDEVEDPLDGVDDPLDEVDDPVDDATDELDDAADELGDAGQDASVIERPQPAPDVTRP